jgi:ketosteroid isomerase-like protein
VATEHPHAIAYRDTAEAFRSGDMTTLATLIAPDVLWHVPGSHPLAGDVRGRERLLEWLAALRPLGFWLSEHDVLGNDDHVVALSTFGARREGVDVQTRVISVMHFRDGQQLERWFHPEDLTAWHQIYGG